MKAADNIKLPKIKMMSDNLLNFHQRWNKIINSLLNLVHMGQNFGQFLDDLVKAKSW